MKNPSLNFFVEKWVRWQFGKREFGLKRGQTSNINDVITAINNGEEAYLSVFSMQQLENNAYDTIFIDIDTGEDGLKKFYDAVDIIPSRLYFSGAKGFHIYFDLRTPIIGRERYKYSVIKFVEENNLENIVDKAVVGDVRRMARVVGSINAKSGLRMIELNPNIFPLNYRELSAEGKSYASVYEYLYEKELFERDHGVIKEGEAYSPKKIFEDKYYPACIINAINLLVNVGELDHKERLTLALFLLKNGEEEKLREILKFANDYKPSYTDYQVNYLKKRNYSIYKCENIPSTICPFKDKRDCPFYPSLNHVWVKK